MPPHPQNTSAMVGNLKYRSDLYQFLSTRTVSCLSTDFVIRDTVPCCEAVAGSARHRAGPGQAMAAARRHRALWLAAAAAAALLVACAADEKESMRMVDDYQGVAQAKRKQGAGEGNGAACRAAANEPTCALRNGCAWCLRAGTSRRGAAAAARLREDEAGAADARRCFAWRECTGPVSL